MKKKIIKLKKIIKNILKKFLKKIKINIKYNELNIFIKYNYYIKIIKILYKNKKTKFKQLIDLCGVDYLSYNRNKKNKYRFAIILNILSIKFNFRLRLYIFAKNNNNPNFPTIINIWKSANWYEREAFDLYGIFFNENKYLSRILTDYDFIGFPFRKDFPMSGYNEIYYNNKRKCVCYKNTYIKQKEIIYKNFFK